MPKHKVRNRGATKPTAQAPRPAAHKTAQQGGQVHGRKHAADLGDLAGQKGKKSASARNKAAYTIFLAETDIKYLLYSKKDAVLPWGKRDACWHQIQNNRKKPKPPLGQLRGLGPPARLPALPPYCRAKGRGLSSGGDAALPQKSRDALHSVLHQRRKRQAGNAGNDVVAKVHGNEDAHGAALAHGYGHGGRDLA